MKKKGFTLVELLAVIAILAILVIIALPNVINLFNKAQKEMFLTETRKVYSEAERKFLTESISGKNVKVINSEDNTKLDMNGEKLQYCIILNNDGEVTSMKVSNGKWVASLGGNKTVSDLTVDDLEEGNLDDYECGEPATSESCFTYEIGEEPYGVPVVTINDTNKCKNYLLSKFGIEEVEATTLCNGEKYDTYTIYSMVYDDIPPTDYSTAGITVKNGIIDKAKVEDVAKCKNYFSQDLSAEETTKLCETNEAVNGVTLEHAIISGGVLKNNYIIVVGNKIYSAYDELGVGIGLKDSLNTVTIITGYDTSCGTDVVIPSKIQGYDVTAINPSAFRSCYGHTMITNDNDYKLLSYNFNDDYLIKKMDTECNGDALTSVVLPKTLIAIGKYAFAYNNLKSVVIPENVRYIYTRAFSYNDISFVDFKTDVANINFFNGCPFIGNYNYDKSLAYCPK